MKYSLLTALALCSSFMSLAAADGSHWMTDYAAAKKKAAESKKDLLLEFTGSDWRPPCMELTKEVFSKEAFTTGAEANFILVVLDFPRDESKLTEGLKDQNEKLATQYGIDSFPTIVLADAKGRPYAQTGFQEGGPEAYLKHLGDGPRHGLHRAAQERRGPQGPCRHEIRRAGIRFGRAGRRIQTAHRGIFHRTTRPKQVIS